MPNAQYPSYPMRDWSSEISQPHTQVSSASTTTTTTATSTTSSHAGAAPGYNNAPAMPQAPGGQSSGPAVSSQGSASAPGVQASVSSGAASAGSAAPAGPMSLAPGAPRSEFEGSIGTLDLQTHQPIEVVEAPASMNEAFLGSLKSMLLRNRGNFVTATFLIGTQGTTAWEGILHDVGNDYIIIYQPGRQRYIACDIYSLKYIEFYDTQHQQMCETLLRQNGWQNHY